MATSEEFIAFVLEQIATPYPVRYRKMFGEYMVYVNEKPVLLVCDNTVFVKKIGAIEELMQSAACGVPYEGAKEHYILDIENRELTERAVALLEEATPLPKKKIKRGSL